MNYSSFILKSFLILCFSSQYSYAKTPKKILTDSEVIELSKQFLPPTVKRFTVQETVKAEMGYALFRDLRFSINNKVACATCHPSDKLFADLKIVSEGVFHLSRNAPTVINSRFRKSFFWDGRVSSLEEQAKIPVETEAEHGITRGRVAQLILQNYKPLYEHGFGAFPKSIIKLLQSKKMFQAYPEVKKTKFRVLSHNVQLQPQNPFWVKNWNSLDQKQRDAIDQVFDNFAKSIAIFQRGLIAEDSPFDLFIKKLQQTKDIKKSLNKKFRTVEYAGFRVFIERAQCIKCHNGPDLTDDKFHNTALIKPSLQIDLGRASAFVTHPMSLCQLYNIEKCPSTASEALLKTSLAQFKTPSLRNVAMTPPYFHNGSIGTLEEVLIHYQSKPTKKALGAIDPLFNPIKLTKAEAPLLSPFP